MIKKFVNEFQRLHNPIPSGPYAWNVSVVGYNTVYIFNNTIIPISWANEYNIIQGYQSKVVYRGNEEEFCTGILNIFLGEQISGNPSPECTVVKKKYI